MENKIWGLIVIVGFFLAFLVGYNVSSGTGVEPGYFEAPDAGGYGAGTEGAAPEGIPSEFQEHYKELSK